MKSIIILCSLFIVSSLNNTVYSYSIHKLRFFDVIHKTINKDTDTILLEVRPHKFVRSTTTTTTTASSVTEQSQLIEDKEEEKETKLKPRESWDSEEDHYFKWASLNRRPMESLAGRKRSINKILKNIQTNNATQSNKLID